MTGMAGELGHINVEPDGHPCNCGSRGCLEQLASATAIKRMATEAAAAGKAPQLEQVLKQADGFSSKAVYDLAMRGDAPAKEIFRKVGNALGTVIADLINVFNVPMYVLGGGVASAWDAFAPTMMEVVRKNSFVYRATASAEGDSGNNAKGKPARVTVVRHALLGGDAGLIGAARLPMITAPRDRVEAGFR
jgi:glucokinase